MQRRGVARVGIDRGEETTAQRGACAIRSTQVRKLMLVGRGRLTGRAHNRIKTGWHRGDLYHEVAAAWYGNQPTHVGRRHALA